VAYGPPVPAEEEDGVGEVVDEVLVLEVELVLVEELALVDEVELALVEELVLVLEVTGVEEGVVTVPLPMEVVRLPLSM